MYGISTFYCLFLSVDEDMANRAAKQVQVTYTDQKPPILSIEDAIKQGSYFPNPGKEVKKGDAQSKYTDQKLLACLRRTNIQY
jgi:xanthine dehydrogenase molybdopterin-binding subunit B